MSGEEEMTPADRLAAAIVSHERAVRRLLVRWALGRQLDDLERQLEKLRAEKPSDDTMED